MDTNTIDSELTPAQFRMIERLSRAYGHLWATLLDFHRAAPSPEEPTRRWGDVVGRSRSRGSLSDQVIYTVRDACDSGLPPPLAVFRWMTQLSYSDEPGELTGIECPQADHTTCSGRTRWQVLPDRDDGLVWIDRFDSLGNHVARIVAWEAGDGVRALLRVPNAEMALGQTDLDRIRFALAAVGLTVRQQDAAIAARCPANSGWSEDDPNRPADHWLG